MSNVRNVIGTNEILPVKINISEEIKDNIKRFSTSDLTRELGGVLIGKVYETENKTYEVKVENYIIAQHTNAALSSVTFTAETWAQINDEMDTKYPDLKIIGWFHTHPGFGIFLSNWDIFIQQNFFNIPWQIAYVVDPCHKTDGFFIWKENEILKISENSFNDLPKQDNSNELNDLSEKSPTPLPEQDMEDSEDLQVQLKNLYNRMENSQINKSLGKYSKKISYIFIVILLCLIIIIIGKYILKNKNIDIQNEIKTKIIVPINNIKDMYNPNKVNQ